MGLEEQLHNRYVACWGQPALLRLNLGKDKVADVEIRREMLSAWCLKGIAWQNYGCKVDAIAFETTGQKP